MLKITEEIAAEIKAKIKSLDFDQIEKIKKAKDVNGTFDVIISTEVLDRSGEIVRQDGWDLSNYKNNPVVLWGHNYYELGIGICTETYNTTFRGVPALGARGVFYPADINPLAQQVRKMYEFGQKLGVGAGCTTSVGFIPKEFDANDRSIITRAELLEFSFVPIPANQGVGPAAGRAITMEEAKTLGLDMEVLKTKGIDFVNKIAEAGSRCELDDGSPGILAGDPSDPDGPLVCVPDTQDKGQGKSGEESNMNQEKLYKALDTEKERHQKALHKHIDEFKSKAAHTAEDQGHIEDANEKKSAVHSGLKKHLKSLRSAIKDEHAMHRAVHLDAFRSYEPTDEKKKKAAEHEDHLKAVRETHDDYEEKCHASLDKFDEKMLKSVEGEPGEADDHTDWITGKVTSHSEQAHKAVVKCAKAMVKAFGESEETEEKAWYLKGAVADELSESEERQAKWQKVDHVYSVFGAFINAYLEDEVPVADFEKLLDEAVALMKGTESKAAKGMAALVVKIGLRVSADMDGELGEALKLLQSAKTIVEALHGGLGDGDGEVKPAEKVAPITQRSKPASGADGKDELDSHLFARSVLRGIVTATTSALEQLHEARKRGQK